MQACGSGARAIEGKKSARKKKEEGIQLMRSSAVGIDKQKNGFVNLSDFPVCLNFFKPCIG
jgi:hypothetical protein